MKRILVLALVALSAALVLAEATNAAPKKRRRPRRPSAGVLERPLTAGQRSINVVDRQKAVAAAAVADAVREARWKSNLPLKIDAKDAPATIELVESEAFGMMVVYPEEMKAAVNVRALATDKPAPEVLAKRLRTELARAALFMLGSGSVNYMCLTMPVHTAADLDKLERVVPGAEVFTRLGAGKAVGITPLRYTSYEVACQEGWAPAPTNDVQKAVWDKVHALPTAPLTIKPETKKVAQ